MLAQLRTALAKVREFFLVEDAERRASTLTDSQRRSLGAPLDAAVKRLRVARLLHRPELRSVSLSLYRESLFMLASAWRASRGGDAEDVEVGRHAIFDALDEALKATGSSSRSMLERSKPVLIASDLMALDSLAPAEATRVRDDLEAVTRDLSTSIEAHLPRHFARMRVRRLTVLAAFCVVLLLWLVAPRNLALHKMVRSTQPAFDTAPAGAVDGERNGRFGFHSVEVDSPWLIIDLARKHHISSVRVFGRGDCCFDQSVPLVLEVSGDGDSFRTIAEREAGFTEADPWVVEPDGVAARFVRLRTMRRSVLVLSEVEVYGYFW